MMLHDFLSVSSTSPFLIYYRDSGYSREKLHIYCVGCCTPFLVYDLDIGGQVQGLTELLTGPESGINL